jgi:hypothetical protein
LSHLIYLIFIEPLLSAAKKGTSVAAVDLPEKLFPTRLQTFSRLKWRRHPILRDCGGIFEVQIEK